MNSIFVSTYLFLIFLMHHHNHHVLWDITHFKGRVFWSIVSILVLWISIQWWSTFWYIWSVLRVIIGCVVLLYLPGYRITEAARHGEHLSVLEHIALSIAFSLAVIPLLVFYVNLLWVPITEGMILAFVGIVVGVCIAWKIRHKQHT